MSEEAAKNYVMLTVEEHEELRRVIQEDLEDDVYDVLYPFDYEEIRRFGEGDRSPAGHSNFVDAWLYQHHLYRYKRRRTDIPENPLIYEKVTSTTEIPFTQTGIIFGRGRFGIVSEAQKINRSDALADRMDERYRSQFVSKEQRKRACELMDELTEVERSSTVSKAQERRSGDLVACKKSTTEHQSLQDAREKFLREVRIMRKLSARDIQCHRVYIIAAFAVDDREFSLYMEPIASGGSLNDFLQHDDGLWTDDNRAALVMAIGCLPTALAMFHEQGILHRDIHGGNILFHEGKALYADFGSSNLASLSDPGSAPAYTAPELLSPDPSSSPQYSEKTDSFALGRILSEIRGHLEGAVRATGRSLPNVALEPLSSLIVDLTQDLSENRMTATRAAIQILEHAIDDSSMCLDCQRWIRERQNEFGVNFRRKLLLPMMVPDNIYTDYNVQYRAPLPL